MRKQSQQANNLSNMLKRLFFVCAVICAVVLSTTGSVVIDDRGVAATTFVEDASSEQFGALASFAGIGNLSTTKPVWSATIVLESQSERERSLRRCSR